MDSQHYFVLEISQVLAKEEELLVAELFSLGAAGVQENLHFEQKDRRYLPEVVDQKIKNLLVYFEKAPSPDLTDIIQSQFPLVRMSLQQADTKDWLAEWKANWKAFELVSPYWIVPEWEKEKFSQAGILPIYIEPGMAFGTGTHATTQIASELIKEAYDQFHLTSAVDVGTGSGILTLLMDKLGFEALYAYDNDPESQRVFNENFEATFEVFIAWS